MSEKKIKGFNFPIDMSPKPVNLWCWCRNCGETWHEETTSPGGACINGPTYYDFCSECKDTFEEG